MRQSIFILENMRIYIRLRFFRLQIWIFADYAVDFYHVGCFENLLDMSSSHYVARFDADRRRYIPDLGAQLIFEEYISRWKLRLSKARDHENTSSSPVEKEGSEDKSPSNTLQPHPATEEEGTSSLLGSSVKTAKKSEEATTEDDKWAIGEKMYEEMREAEMEDTRQALDRFRCKSLFLIF